VFLIPVAMLVALGAFFSVVGFARERRREREALYRYETARALVDKGAMDAAQFQAFEREQALRPWRARLENAKLFGLVSALAGVGLLVGMRAADEAPARGIGWLPLGLGAGALLYCWLLARREP
jgi:hypothetical protein